METLARLSGDIMFLGAAGKMGPTLRGWPGASDLAGVKRRVIAVSRFSSRGEETFTSCGVETIRCDLLDETRLKQLPDATNVVYMPGRKFGSTGDECTTWAVNCYLPATVCQKFSRSRVVAFSTGNVYPLARPETGGPTEADAPDPVGEYGMSALGRERMFGYFSRTLGVPVSIVRLNYAVDLHYGVVVDLRPADSGQSADRPCHGLLQRDLAGRRQRHDAPSHGLLRHSPASSTSPAGGSEHTEGERASGRIARCKASLRGHGGRYRPRCSATPQTGIAALHPSGCPPINSSSMLPTG